jgi:hypothetical protein
MNVVMIKRCNMRNLFSDFNKNIVMPTTGNIDRDEGWLIHKKGGMPRECLRGAQGRKINCGY